MLTIAKMHSDSVAYYESTVDSPGSTSGPDLYYSEDGKQPATAWVVGRNDRQVATVSRFLGVDTGDVIAGESVRKWFNSARTPSEKSLGRRPGKTGVPGFDLTFCAPKSVSLVWGFADNETKKIVDDAHSKAVSVALAYLSEHAGYTRRASDHDPELMILDRVSALSGVKYEHKTSRAGDPHVHSHVLLNNRQLCPDGKGRTIDSTSLYHEARAAGMLYQSVLRATLSKNLGVQWGDVSKGCAEIAGLNDPKVIEAYSTRMRDIDAWKEENGLDSAAGERMGQKATRRVKDTDTSLDELHARWRAHDLASQIQDMVDGFTRGHQEAPVRGEVVVPTSADVINAVIAERSTFTRADLVEKTAELMPVGLAPDEILVQVEKLVDDIVTTELAWSVNPDMARSHTKTVREGSQRFTAEAVVNEVNQGIDLATTRIKRDVSVSSIVPIDGVLSEDQARAMRAVVASDYRASVVVAPAGAGKTSSLKAARRAWEQAGKNIVGLAPTGKSADVMVREDVAHTSATIARTLMGTEELTPDKIALKLGWNSSTVVVVDEAGMVSTPDMVTLLKVTAAADARIVFVGDPHQYSAVKARSGMLATLAYELPDAVELTEVFRQKHAGERLASQMLRNGDEKDTARAAQWYADHGRLHAGTNTAMLVDALQNWAEDKDQGLESLLVASTREDVDLLNRLAQQVCSDTGDIDFTADKVALSGEHQGFVGDVILTRRNNYDLRTDADDVVRNGQRWIIRDVHKDGSLTAQRMDETDATIHLPADYVKEHVQLGYASTGHSSQGATVDTCHVVAGIGQVDRAGVYVPLTRGRLENHLYLMETKSGDLDTGHGSLVTEERRETAEYARDLLIQAAQRDRVDVTPHQVWRQARVDFELAKLSSNLRVDHDPYAGTRMATVMEQRSHLRRERLDEFYQVRTQRIKKQRERASARALTAEEIVEQSLSSRPLADISGELIDEMVSFPDRVVSTYSAQKQAYDVAVEKKNAADHARALMPELMETIEALKGKEHQAHKVWMQARENLDAEQSKPVLVRLVRGAKLKDAENRFDQARSVYTDISHELNHAQRQRDRGREAIAIAPSGDRVAAQERLVHGYRRAVDGLADQSVLMAEYQWRHNTSREVLKADRLRRNPEEKASLTEWMGTMTRSMDLAAHMKHNAARSQQQEQQQPPPQFKGYDRGGYEL